MSILSEALSGTLLGSTASQCLPLPNDPSVAEATLHRCAGSTVEFTEAVMLLCVGMLLGVTIVIGIYNYLLIQRTL